MRTPRIRIFARIIFSFLVLAGLLALRPVSTPTPENCDVITGIAEEIRVGDGEADIVVQMADDDAYYYINRGLESGLELSELRQSLEGHQITLAYVRHWSTLNLSGRNRHIAQISVGGEEIYSEMQ